MRIGFILIEVLGGFWCNILMVIFVVFVMFVLLMFVGVVIFMQNQIGVMCGYWVECVQVVVYMCLVVFELDICIDGVVSEEQVDVVCVQLEGEVFKFFISLMMFDIKEEIYVKFVVQFGEDQVSVFIFDQVFEVFFVIMKDLGQLQVFVEVFSGQVGVEQVKDQLQYFELLFFVLMVVMYIVVGIVVFMFIVVMLFIGIIICFFVYVRCKEIGIMCLVGVLN